MRSVTLAPAIFAAAMLSAEAASAAPVMQPPMNSFDSAYYTCDSGGAFLISYVSGTPKLATLTTSNNNKHYSLKRTPVSTGAQFQGDGATFWTDGKTVRLEGTETPYANCKMKTG